MFGLVSEMDSIGGQKEPATLFGLFDLNI